MHLRQERRQQRGRARALRDCGTAGARNIDLRRTRLMMADASQREHIAPDRQAVHFCQPTPTTQTSTLDHPNRRLLKYGTHPQTSSA
ncbi:hypothetical protein [Xanthomonas campestris]|uniref:hypothetical protein n=1 Tax=Xanthomonas campestris TaxID=339 RepID=UPI001E557436|nr:hypothetical protein [Xanthomonas campestris]WDK01764.1 hypothetical protein JH273_18560 [Xanthomonas campestris]WVL62155.1 hypothetical protein LLE68_007290 [Xanthomonas campestris pv. barbareae]